MQTKHKQTNKIQKNSKLAIRDQFFFSTGTHVWNCSLLHMKALFISLRSDAISQRNLLNESPLFAKLFIAMTEYLKYFKSDCFSHLL